MKHILFLILLAWGFAASSFEFSSKPVIGISCSNSEYSSSVAKSYSNAINRAGGIALMIPVCTDSITLRNALSVIDGIVLTGGGDIHPSYFGEKPIDELGEVDFIRDIYDIHLIKMAAHHNIPMLGICRGEQLINVAFGGTLYQDLPSQYTGDTLFQHSNTTHNVTFDPESWLANIAGTEQLNTNSIHHQAVKDIAPGFRATGWSDDGVIEVIENIDGYHIWGVQFHPERMFSIDNDSTAAKIFHFFVKKAATFHHAKALHRSIISIDTHTDSPLDFNEGYNIALRGPYQVDLPKMCEGFLDAQYLACWVRQGELTEHGRKNAKQRVDELIKRIYWQVEQNNGICGIARSAQDVVMLKSEGKRAFFIGIENGYAIGKNLKLIESYHNKGVTYITLCHSKNNDICDSSSDKAGAHWNGLSPFGKEVIAEMNRLGVLIDLSHASDNTFWDVLNLSETPVLASHSSSRAMFNCDRNLTDDQLRAIAENGGVVQVCLVDEFLNVNPKDASIEDFMNHLCHIIDIAGIDHVGIGSDFDGGAGVKGCNGDNDMIQITTRLIERGYNDEDIAKIWGGNFLRVLSAAQSYAANSSK